jgi:hypothetical protein
MFIVWGTKRTERRQGAVADFCPICREVRAFELIRVGLASHVYYVSFGEGKLVCFLIECQKCAVHLRVNPARYATTEKGRVADLELLIQKTFPGLRTTLAERLALESEIKRSSAALPAERRDALLMEPFVLLNPAVERRYAGSTQFDKQSGLGCLGTLAVVIGLFFVSFQFRGNAKDHILIATAILGGLGTIYTFVQFHFGPARYAQARIVPPIAQALAPLAPTMDEVARCVDRCKTLGLKIGKAVKAKDICSGLQRCVPG